jgi:hypothetical protein
MFTWSAVIYFFFDIYVFARRRRNGRGVVAAGVVAGVVGGVREMAKERRSAE